MTPNQPLNILLWAPKGSSEAYHGPGSFAYRMYSLSNRQETQVTLVHGSANQPRLDLFREQHYIECPDGVLGRLAFLRKARQWVEANAANFDVLHGLIAYHQTVQPAFQAHQRGLPAVIFVATHGHELADKPGLRRWLGWPRKRRQMVSQLEGIIAMSTAIYDELIECGVDHSRIARIPMGVNTDRFRPAESVEERTELRRQLGLADRPTLIFVGALIRRKQPHLLLLALARLIREGLDCQLVLVGPPDEPDYEMELNEIIRKENLKDHVALVGFTQQIELYHRAADLFSLPAINEGMPAALVEAMSSGLPSLGTPISGISDLIHDGENGRIIRDVDSLVEAWTDYLKNPGMIVEHGQRCRAEILETYSAETVLNAYLKLFRCVIDGRAACEASTLKG